MRALRFLLRKEFLQIVRDRTILGQLLIMPLVQLLILSSAATFEVRSARTAVVDRDRTTASRAVVDRLAASGRFIPRHAGSMAAADDAMLDRRVDMIVAIPAGFERDVVRERRGTVQLVLNAEDGAAAGVTQSYAREILAAYGSELDAGAGGTPMAASGEAPPSRGRPVLEVRRRGWYNTSLEYRAFMVPGILVQLVTLVGTLMTAMNIVREKEAGTLEQLNVTPVGRATFIAAKLIPFWSIALAELAFGLLVARLVFDSSSTSRCAEAWRWSSAAPPSTSSPRSASRSGSRRSRRRSSRRCS
jgi:ABC-2 type transport system permease protein